MFFEEILGLISGSLPDDQGGFTCMTVVRIRILIGTTVVRIASAVTTNHIHSDICHPGSILTLITKFRKHESLVISTLTTGARGTGLDPHGRRGKVWSLCVICRDDMNQTYIHTFLNSNRDIWNFWSGISCLISRGFHVANFGLFYQSLKVVKSSDNC